MSNAVLDRATSIRKNDDPMNVIFAVLSDAANVSQEGKLNILGNFANINASKFPARHPQMQLVIRMEASPVEARTEKNMEVTILDADGGKIAAVSAEFEVPKPKAEGDMVQMQTIISFQGIVFPQPGRYGVYVLIDGNTQVTIPLTLEDTSDKEGE